MSDPQELSDEALSRRLATELPRHAAPARLRSAIIAATPEGPARTRWLAPAVAALATAMIFILFAFPRLPAITAGDPVQRLVGAVVLEHTRALMWGTRRADVIPAALPALAEESGISLRRAFSGDDKLTFVAAEPVYLDWRRGVALHYRDSDGHRVTYIVLPAPGMPVPDRHRVQIDRWRPALIRVGGFSTWLWKQGDLACFIVSDMVSDVDVASFKSHFVRIRTATDPSPAY
jgi:hypothetical protein